MSDRTTRSGTVVACPDCGSSLPSRAVLFDFQFRTGDQGVLRYAECPECDAIVHPIAKRGEWLDRP